MNTILLQILLLAGQTGVEVQEPVGYELNAPVPNWIVEHTARCSTGAGNRDIKVCLIDRQDRVGSDKRVSFTRRIYSIESAAGVEAMGEIRASFLPTHQKLLFHYARIIRNGKAIETLDRSSTRVIHEESELAMRVFNGQVSLIHIFPDLRKGDVIDYAYSVQGSHPLLQNKYQAIVQLGYGYQVDTVRFRLLWPNNRIFKFKIHGAKKDPIIKKGKTHQEYLWLSTNTKPIRHEDSTPIWFDPYPWIQISQFKNWQEVAAWAFSVFDRATQDLGTDGEKMLSEWRRENPDTKSLIQRIVGFVQQEVRYLAVALGEYSLRPHSPNFVISKRYGDCKDKSVLLVSFLRKIGINAWPVLVDSQKGKVLDTYLPSASAFNHVIVKFEFEGKEYWIDPTASSQTGQLWIREFPLFEKGLVISPRTVKLEAIPLKPAKDPYFFVTETFRIKANNKPVALEVDVEYRHHLADRMRELFQSRSLADIEHARLNYYAKSYQGAKLSGKISYQDNPAENIFTTKEHYSLPQFWKNGESVLDAWGVRDELSLPNTVQREFPLAVEYPMHVRHEIFVHVPEDYDLPRIDRVIETEALRLIEKSYYRNRVIHLNYELLAKDDHVDSKYVDKHINAIKEMNARTQYAIVYGNWAASVDPKPLDMAALAGLMGGLLFVPLLMLSIRRWNRRTPKRLKRFQKKQRVGAGESPSDPLDATDVDFALAVAKGRRCHCKNQLEVGIANEILLGEQSGVSISLHCSKCDSQTLLFFRLG